MFGLMQLIASMGKLELDIEFLNDDLERIPNTLVLKISGDIAEKVARQINVRTIFRRKPMDIMRTIKQGMIAICIMNIHAVRKRSDIFAFCIP